MQGPPPSESDLQTAEATLEGLRSRKRAFEEQGGAERAAAPPPDAQHEGWLLQETPSSANDWERRFVTLDGPTLCVCEHEQAAAARTTSAGAVRLFKTGAAEREVSVAGVLSSAVFQEGTLTVDGFSVISLVNEP